MENFNIIEDKENSLFNRKEIKFKVQAEVTPSHADVEKIITEKFSISPETIVIKGIHGGFGSKTFAITANIYKSEEDKLSVERIKKEEKPAEQPTPAPAVEQPAEAQVVEEQKEEKQEEPKPEEKKEELKENAKES